MTPILAILGVGAVGLLVGLLVASAAFGAVLPWSTWEKRYTSLKERAKLRLFLANFQRRDRVDDLADGRFDKTMQRIHDLLKDAPKCRSCRGNGQHPIGETGDYDPCWACAGTGKDIDQLLTEKEL